MNCTKRLSHETWKWVGIMWSLHPKATNKLAIHPVMCEAWHTSENSFLKSIEYDGNYLALQIVCLYGNTIHASSYTQSILFLDIFLISLHLKGFDQLKKSSTISISYKSLHVYFMVEKALLYISRIDILPRDPRQSAIFAPSTHHLTKDCMSSRKDIIQ